MGSCCQGIAQRRNFVALSGKHRGRPTEGFELVFISVYFYLKLSKFSASDRRMPVIF